MQIVFQQAVKTELVHHRKFKTRQQAIQEITEYIEIFYNQQRKQGRLGYLSPAELRSDTLQIKPLLKLIAHITLSNDHSRGVYSIFLIRVNYGSVTKIKNSYI